MKSTQARPTETKIVWRKNVLTGASILLVTVLSYGCDFHYRHDVLGRVASVTGEPLEGVEVARKSSEGGEIMQPSSRYKVTTAADGSFHFLYEGTGGRPIEVDTWHLTFSKAGYHPKNITVQVPWVDTTERPFGYILDDIEVEMQALTAAQPSAPSAISSENGQPLPDETE